MAWSTELDELVQQTVVVKTLASIDGYGEETFSTAGTTYSARVVWKPHRVSDWAGDEHVAQAQVIIATTNQINLTDQVVIYPGTTREETPTILYVREVPWVDGNTHHTALSVGGRRGRETGGWS